MAGEGESSTATRAPRQLGEWGVLELGYLTLTYETGPDEAERLANAFHEELKTRIGTRLKGSALWRLFKLEIDIVEVSPGSTKVKSKVALRVKGKSRLAAWLLSGSIVVGGILGKGGS